MSSRLVKPTCRVSVSSFYILCSSLVLHGYQWSNSSKLMYWFVLTGVPNTDSKLQHYKQLMLELPLVNYCTLKRLILHLVECVFSTHTVALFSTHTVALLVVCTVSAWKWYGTTLPSLVHCWQLSDQQWEKLSRCSQLTFKPKKFAVVTWRYWDLLNSEFWGQNVLGFRFNVQETTFAKLQLGCEQFFAIGISRGLKNCCGVREFWLRFWFLH